MNSEQIIYLRKSLGISQEELARRLNVSFVTVNCWESGQTKPQKKNKENLISLEKQRNKNVKQKERTFRSIQYLGSKMKLVDQIENLVNKYSTGDTFCDLFAGSGVVSNKIAQNYTVKACDIQEYSRIITTALFEKSPLNETDIIKFISLCTNSNFYTKLIRNLNGLIKFETDSLNLAKSGETNKLIDFSKNCSLYIHKFDHENVNQNSDLYRIKEKYLKKTSATGANITLLYGGVYFSFEQTAFIDSVLNEIKNSNLSENISNFFLAVTLSTASEIVNTVGKQFAQPMKLIDRNGKPKKLLIERTIRDKSYIPENLFSRYALKYISSAQLVGEKKHEFYRMDFEEFLRENVKDVNCFYADPPYTIDHYSRFYHVLETISRQDLPNLARMNKNGLSVIMNGMYRDDRHQSPFCIPSQAFDAFEKMIKGCSKFGAPLIISYSPYDKSNDERPRLLKTDEITDIAKKYYENIEIVDVESHTHRKLHSTNKNNKTIQSGEIFIICSNKLQ